MEQLVAALALRAGALVNWSSMLINRRVQRLQDRARPSPIPLVLSTIYFCLLVEVCCPGLVILLGKLPITSNT
jgi:hypothetical protein